VWVHKRSQQIAAQVSHGARLVRIVLYQGELQLELQLSRSEASDEVVLSHDLDVLTFVLERERLGRLAGEVRARRQDSWVYVADDKDVGVLRDVEFGDATDLDHVIPAICRVLDLNAPVNTMTRP
jgi:hypothetical protein